MLTAKCYIYNDDEKTEEKLEALDREGILYNMLLQDYGGKYIFASFEGYCVMTASKKFDAVLEEHLSEPEAGTMMFRVA